MNTELKSNTYYMLDKTTATDILKKQTTDARGKKYLTITYKGIEGVGVLSTAFYL